MGVQPVAVIGLGCRFAGGVDSPDSFWDMLVHGRDGTGEVPAERWRPYAAVGAQFAAALRRATRFGAFLSDVDSFDADFFGISPREAALMDPQQRILLEVAWEALEHAGIPPHDLAGSDAGVFVGIGSDDYGRRMLEDLPRIEAWTGIGAGMCAAANRISYALDLRGPSLAVDTACSASLVAVHLACQSLRAGEGPVALAAGVNLVVSPGMTLTLDAAGAMAPDGRCKSFDESADGYGRGEGCGVLVLKLLADALRDGDRVLSVIRGSAVNQDGRTNGIMAPSGPAQEYVLARACAQAEVGPASVGYVEAHGTGTRLGDPLEAGALGAVYGAGRPPDRPCLIGSVKSNIGHLEAAAGVASMIKATLVLHHGEIPPSLHFTAGNPAIDWPAAGLRVVTERTAWAPGDTPRRAGVSGFGYGGTIAHVLLEEAPTPARVEAADGDRSRLLPLSASSPAALREYAGRLAGWLDGPGADAPLGAVGYTLARRRSHLAHRAVAVGSDRGELSRSLRSLAADGAGPGVVTGAAAGPDAGPVWVFSGHGSQWVGMGRELLAYEPVFAAVLETLEPIFLDEIGLSPRRVLVDGDLDRVDRIQTTIFAAQLGLAEVWRSYGVRPAAVIGHSVGEIAAAVTAGALSLADGARLICRRSALLRRVAGKGGMAMVGLPFDEVAQALAGRSDVVPAIWSAPASTVVAGDPEAVEELVERWRGEGVPIRRVASDIAFHSPHMDPLVADLAKAADELRPRPPRIPLYSTAMAEPRGPYQLDSSYWAANLRNPVRLAAAVRAAVEDGHHAFLEISTHPLVAHSIRETTDHAGLESAFVGASLRRGRPERATLLENLGALHCHGVAVDWAHLYPAGELVTPPPVAWQRRRHWRDSVLGGGGDGLALDVDSHTVLGAPVPVAGAELRLWRAELTDEGRPYPGSHTIDGVEIAPAAVLLSTLLHAAGGDRTRLADVALRNPLMVGEPREVQVLHDAAGLRIASRTRADGGAWVTHVTAAVGSGHAEAAPPERLGDPPAGLTEADPEIIRRRLADVGVPTMAFEWTVESLSLGTGSLRARVRADAGGDTADGAPRSWAPLLDAATSVAPAAYPGPPRLRMVAGVDEVRLLRPPPPAAVVEVTLDPERDDTVRVLLATGDGQVVGWLAGLRYAPLDAERASADPGSLVHEVTWRTLELGTGPSRPVVLVGPPQPLVEDLSAQWTAAGRSVRVCTDPELLEGWGAGSDVVVVPPLAAGETATAAAAAEAAWLLTRVAQRLAPAAVDADPPRLWCLTAGVRESASPSHLALAPLWGLGRVFSGEYPTLWGGLVDLDAEDPPGAAGTLLDVLRAAPGEDVIAIRGGTVSAARLAPMAGTPVTEPVRCHADGTYLITGGLGVLGQEVAGWLASRGARRIVLAGRQPLPPRSTWDELADGTTRQRVAGIRRLEALGVTVRAVSLDIADADEAARLLDPDALGLPPIRGVVHAAGVLDSRLIPGVDEASLRAVMRPKVAGALSLHRLFPPGTLDFLVLFSSCGQLLGVPGQATYGAANAFLDALATHRRAAGHTDTTSFGWTSWRGRGMAVNEVADAELHARGVTDISVPEAFAAWDFAACRGGGHLAVLRTLPPEPGTLRLPLLSELPAPGTAEPATGGPAADPFEGLTAGEVRERLVGEVGTQIAGEMKLSTQDLDPRRPLTEQGLDSVMTVLIRRRLEKRYGRSLPATLLWHQPTVTAIADHLTDLLVPTAPPTD